MDRRRCFNCATCKNRLRGTIGSCKDPFIYGVKAGDAVFGSTGMRMGGNAEYKCRTEKALAIKPAALSFDDAASLSVGGINALHFLGKANIYNGQKLLIIGAGGAIGSYGVQLAKLYGAEVTAVDTTAKVAVLLSIGADHVIDYTQGIILKSKTIRRDIRYCLSNSF